MAIADKDLRRFEGFITPEPMSGCWLWLGAVGDTGYGNFWLHGKTMNAHKLSYVLSKGDVPDGLELDHKCRVRSCVNPYHLEPVTTQENQRRGLNYNRKACPKGHSYANPRNRGSRTNGRRYCAECARINAANQRAKCR